MNARHLILTVFFGLLLCSMSGHAQTAKPGGYYSIATHGDDVAKAAAFAIKAHDAKAGERTELVRILEAERQIVAGTNYRLVLRVKSGAAGEREVAAVVFRSLQGSLELKSWTEH